MSFSLLSMLYIQAAQSEIENRQANASKARKKRTNLERREPTPTLLDVTDTDTVNVQTSEVEMLCRICGEVTDNVSIFQNRGDRNIVKDITTIASVQIEENDGLPNHICEACLDLLNKAVLFKKRCEEMDSEFRRKLKEMQEARIEEQESFDSHNELEYENSVNNFDSDFSSFFSNDNENIGIMDEDCNDKYSDTIEVKDGFIDCLICSRSFIDKDEYKRHLSNCNSFFEKSCKEKQLKFSEEFPWLCDICGKSFKLKGNQSMHRMSHTDELPYSCDMCPYRGRTSYNLRSHIRTHTGERPYKCPHCPQKFINASNRKRHLTVHEKNRRYKCSICHKGISTKRALIDHEKSVHFGVKAYECEICKLCFSNMKNVRKHKIRIHKVRAKHGRKVCTYLRVDEEKKEKQSELQANHSGNEH